MLFFEETTDFDEEEMEDDVCGNIKIEIKEESIVDNEAHSVMENEDFTLMEVNISDIMADQEMLFAYKENGTNDVVQSNVEQNSVHILNKNILEKTIDKSVVSYIKNDNDKEDIVTESVNKLFKEKRIGECNETDFKNEDVKSNQTTKDSDERSFHFNLQNHKAPILHHVDSTVFHSNENSIDKMDEDEAAVLDSELIIEDVKTEGGDNLDDGTCNENVYKTLLGTSKELFVSLKREDLLKLQKTFKEEGCLRFQETPKRWKSPCKLCSFTANHRFDLLAHIAGTHKDLAIEMKILPLQNMFPGREPHQIGYRCTDCAYITQRKSYLVIHLLSHKQLHEEETFSCAPCPYVTKLKEQLIDHMEKNKKESKIVPYKCPYCYAFFRHEQYLKRHIKFLHEVEKLEKLECKKCSFKTVYENVFREHVLTHNKPGKISFQTPHKSVLRNSHHLLDKSDEETRKYQCAHCTFQGKTRDSIIRHLLVHKRPAKAVMHECDKPNKTQTKHKCQIRRHQQVHQDLDEPEPDLVLCNFCPYKGRTNYHLRTHMKLEHPNSNEVKIYSRNTSDVKRHNLNAHSLSKETTFYQCVICIYKAKTEYEVKQHFKRVHEKSPKEEVV